MKQATSITIVGICPECEDNYIHRDAGAFVRYCPHLETLQFWSSLSGCSVFRDKTLPSDVTELVVQGINAKLAQQ